MAMIGATTEEPPDAAYPRYFVHRRGFSRRSLFIRFDGPDELVAVMVSGTEERVKGLTVMWTAKLADKGILREITARDADTLLAKANVQRATESTGARRSKV